MKSHGCHRRGASPWGLVRTRGDMGFGHDRFDEPPAMLTMPRPKAFRLRVLPLLGLPDRERALKAVHIGGWNRNGSVNIITAFFEAAENHLVAVNIETRPDDFQSFRYSAPGKCQHLGEGSRFRVIGGRRF